MWNLKGLEDPPLKPPLPDLGGYGVSGGMNLESKLPTHQLGEVKQSSLISLGNLLTSLSHILNSFEI